MAVSLRGFTQMVIDWGGTNTVPWPAGTIVGDLAVLFCQDGRRRPADTSGWTAVYGSSNCTVWYKPVAAADLSASLVVKAELVGLQTFVNGATVGRHRDYHGLRTSMAGGGILIFGEEPPPATWIAPADGNRLGNPVPSPGYGTNQLWYLSAPNAAYYGLSPTEWSADYQAWEITPVLGPKAPTLDLPAASSTVDPAAATVFSWVHNSTAGRPQERAKLRVRQWTSGGTGTWYYLTSSGAWSTTDTTLVSSSQTAPLNAGLLSANVLYEWQVQTYDSGTWSPWASPVQVTPRAKPTVSAVSVTVAAGSLTPVLAWTPAISYGVQEAWEARVAPADQSAPDIPVWGSQVRAGVATTTQAPSTAGWVRDQSLHGWVRIMQTGGMWSAWARTVSPFVVTWTPPAAPTSVTLTASTTGPLAVTVAGIAAGQSGLEVQTSTDAGAPWVEVRVLGFPDSDVAVELPLAEYGVPLLARARSWIVVDDVRLFSDWTVSGSEVAAAWRGSCMVSDDGTEWLPILLARGADASRELVQGVAVSFGLGADRARVDRGETAGERGHIIAYTMDAGERAALKAWVTGRDVWAVRWGAEVAGAAWVSAGVTRMGLAGPVTTGRFTGRHAMRTIEFDWVEQ